MWEVRGLRAHFLDDEAGALAHVSALWRHRAQGGHTVSGEELRRRVDAIAGDVEELVDAIVGLRSELEASGAIMPPMFSYRLAVVLSRVDHAAAEIVLQQARRLEVEGQLPAFPELEPELLAAEPFSGDPA